MSAASILIGADPEVFVRHQDKPFSAFGMVPGTKKEPFKVPNGALQVDGMALEFNIEPADSCQTFVHNMQSVFSKLQSMIPKDMQIDIVPSVRFDWDHMEAQPEEAKELGCDPDYSAYTGERNPRPNGKTNLRTASGHVHIGWTNGAKPDDPFHFGNCISLVKELDFYLGIPSLLLDKDTERRKLYGKAGAFRPKSYGVEYRVLSNFWLKDQAHMEWVFNTTLLATNALMNGISLAEKYNMVAQHAIDGDVDADGKINNIKRLYPQLWTAINTFNHLI